MASQAQKLQSFLRDSDVVRNDPLNFRRADKFSDPMLDFVRDIST